MAKQSRLIELEEVKTQVLQKVGEVLFVDQKIMNFNTYLPGKLLGSNLLVCNKTDCEQIIELSVDQQSYTYNKLSLAEQFPETYTDKDSLPFKLDED